MASVVVVVVAVAMGSVAANLPRAQFIAARSLIQLGMFPSRLLAPKRAPTLHSRKHFLELPVPPPPKQRSQDGQTLLRVHFRRRDIVAADTSQGFDAELNTPYRALQPVGFRRRRGELLGAKVAPDGKSSAADAS
jgi:hypothetical protein